MANRKKRLMKGIASIGKQIEIHKRKKERAYEWGKFELAKYYEKEIASQEKAKMKKEEQLKRKIG